MQAQECGELSSHTSVKLSWAGGCKCAKSEGQKTPTDQISQRDKQKKPKNIWLTKHNNNKYEKTNLYVSFHVHGIYINLKLNLTLK
jgi:hypothetical protein